MMIPLTVRFGGGAGGGTETGLRIVGTVAGGGGGRRVGENSGRARVASKRPAPKPDPSARAMTAAQHHADARSPTRPHRTAPILRPASLTITRKPAITRVMAMGEHDGSILDGPRRQHKLIEVALYRPNLMQECHKVRFVAKNFAAVLPTPCHRRFGR